MEIKMRYLTFILLGLLLVTGGAQAQDTGDMEEILMGQPGIVSHELKIELDPETHMISATDMVTLDGPVSGLFNFVLNKNFTIESITCNGSDLDFTEMEFFGSDTGEVDASSNLMIVQANLDSDMFEISYSGEIYDPIDPGKALSHVRGDYTSGLIAPEGIYLSSESGWYPDTWDSMALYSIQVYLPEGWVSISQGNKIVEEGGYDVWWTDVASDGCVLVANQYFVNSRVIGDVVCSTYFYQDNPDLSNQFLDKLEDYLPIYSDLFGPYPYSRFDVVENFFSTGYGMPGFTLLGSHVLMMPYATLEGSLGHELVHCWWGNYVYPDWENGNWCEGLTAFSTNYLWNEIAGGEEQAKDYRFGQMMKYSIQVTDEDEYPIRQFRSKWTEVDGHIGYGKTAGVFIQLRDIVGEDIFFESLREITRRFGGKHADWDDFENVFEGLSGKDLTTFFDSWIETTDLPDLHLENISTTEEEDGWVTSYRVAQDGTQFQLSLPVLITTVDGETAELKTELNGTVVEARIKTAEKPVSIEIDPDYTIFRRLDISEIPPCLNSTLASDNLIIILPSGGTEDIVEVRSYYGTEEQSVHDLYQGLAERVIQSGHDARIIYDYEYETIESGLKSILSFGNPRYNSFLAQSVEYDDASLVQDWFDLDILENGFIINGTEYTGDDYSLLLSISNPWEINERGTIYLGNSPQSIFKAGYIFFYGWDSWVVYENGNPVDRGTWDTGPSKWYYEIE